MRWLLSVLTKHFDFHNHTVHLFERIEDVQTLSDVISLIFKQPEVNLPSSKESLILLKPNLNNDLNALTGNSTDMRVLVTVVKYLQSDGYRKIIIADGPNAGISRRGIDVISRLKIDKLGKYLGVQVLNLNQMPGVEVELTNGKKAQIANICFEADYFINLPVLKTHAEAQLSICCKNLVGCLVSENKRVAHDNLLPNIVRLNEIVKPHLHIVDALMCMEGNGPGDGIPRKLGAVISGNDAFLTDLICARLVGSDVSEIKYLELAQQQGFLQMEDKKYSEMIAPIATFIKAPKPTLPNRILNNKVFTRLRKAMRPVVYNRLAAHILYKLKLSQDIYIEDDDIIEKLSITDRTKCKNCNAPCINYCPIELPVNSPDFEFAESECIKCLYCHLVCSEDIIEIEGTLGFFLNHKRKYRKLIQNQVNHRMDE